QKRQPGQTGTDGESLGLLLDDLQPERPVVELPHLRERDRRHQFQVPEARFVLNALTRHTPRFRVLGTGATVWGEQCARGRHPLEEAPPIQLKHLRVHVMTLIVSHSCRKTLNGGSYEHGCRRMTQLSGGGAPVSRELPQTSHAPPSAAAPRLGGGTITGSSCIDCSCI